MDAGAQVAGGLTNAAGMVRSGLTLAGRVGSGLLPRIAGYGAEGAAYGAAHGAGSTFSDRHAEYLENAVSGARTGATIGAVLPVAGTTAGALYRGARALAGPAIEGAGRGASALLRGAAQADEAGLRALATRGPEAMLPDAGPSMLGLAQGAGTGTGPGRTALVNALRERDAGTGDRLARVLDDQLGPAPVPSQIAASIREGQRALGPAYEEAFRNARAVDAKPIADALDAQIVNLRGPAQDALKQVRAMLDIPGSAATPAEAASGWGAYLRQPSLDRSPRTLHAVREAIDGMMETAKSAASPNSKVVAALADTRRMIDDELASKVPGIKEVDARFAELARQKAALERGQEIFDTGRGTVMRPVELSDQMQAGALPQGLQVGPSAVPFRTRQGARAEIDRIVGTQVNDLNALERTFATPRDWNNQKAGIVFGEKPRDKVVEALLGERRMRQTYHDVDRNSQTAPRNAAAKSMEAADGNIPLETTAFGASARAIQTVMRALMGASSAKAKDEIGQLMAKQGPEAERIVEALLEHIKKSGERARSISRLFGQNPAYLGAGGSAGGRK